MATMHRVISEQLFCLSNYTWSSQQGRAARSRDRDGEVKADINEEQEQWDTTDGFAFLYVKNTLYHIS